MQVDAALDLSHTQNIGYVLKNHFAKSQFLVVSLKEGLFNNANVIYRFVLSECNNVVVLLPVALRGTNASVC